MSAQCCMNCKHKKEVVVAVSTWVDLTKPHCRKFGSLVQDKVKGDRILHMPCEEAMKEFCGGADWEPRFLDGLLRRIGIKGR